MSAQPGCAASCHVERPDRCNSVCRSDIKKLESLMTGGVITTAALGADSKKLEQACFVALSGAPVASARLGACLEWASRGTLCGERSG
jgi:hypothetical protein